MQPIRMNDPGDAKVTLSLFDTDASRGNPQKTFPIFGVPRGGTTSVAGCVQRLGVFLGEGLPNNLEDRAFARPAGPAAEVVAARNAAHPVWGWKFPNGSAYLDNILGRLRNPRLIVVTRDLTANAIGISARDTAYDAMRALELSLLTAQKNLSMIIRLRRPALLISYEKLVLKPEPVIRDLAGFLSLDVSEERIAEAVEFVRPGSYRRKAE